MAKSEWNIKATFDNLQKYETWASQGEFGSAF